MDKQLENIKFVFYIPGSMGSLFSVCLDSQITKNFKFKKFTSTLSTAHSHVKHKIANTHTYLDLLNFQKKKISIEEHLTKNLQDNVLPLYHRMDITWYNSFPNNFDKTICYLENFESKIYYYYTKLKNVDFEMRKSWLGDNKKLHYVEIIEMIKWYSNIEKNLLPNAKKINMSKFVKKDFDDFTKHVKITNKSILEKIIDEYNTRNKIKLDLLPKAINDYCKKIKNNV